MNLEEATRHLYEIFQSYPLKGGLRERSCECCVSGDEIRELVSQPLERLTAEEIGHFARSAVSTFGDINDLKHFLPRILELMRISDNGTLSDFLTFEKLNYAEWETWGVVEIEAIDNYFLALWNDIISDEEASISQIEEALTLVSKYRGIDGALKIWEQKYSKISIELIVEYALVGNNLKLKEFDHDKFTQWISKELTLQRIEGLFLETTDEIEASRISIAFTILENLKRN